MCQPSSYDQLKFDKDAKLEDILNTPDDSDKEFSHECDLSYRDKIEDRSNKVPFLS